MEAWLIILASLSACFFIKLLFSLLFSSKTTKDGELPPGPKPLPFIGHLHLLPKSTIELRSLISNLSQKFGPILTLRVASKPLIFITSYPIAHQALVKNNAIFANRPPIVPVSYVLSNKRKDIGGSPYGNTWRLLRRNLMSEALHSSGVKSYTFARKRSLETMINGFKQCSQDDAVRLFEHLHLAVFSLFILMTYGDIGDDAIKAVEHIQYKFLVSYSEFSVFATWPTLGKLIYRKKWERYNDFLKRQYDVLMPHIRTRQKLKQEKGTKEVDLVTYTDTLLDLEITEGAGNQGKLDDADVLSLSSEFINAGADTTATMFHWIMAHLVKDPRIQAKLFAEISRVVEQGAEEVKEEDLHKILYLKAVILECLRMHPPNASLVPHTNTEDMELYGYNIPKDTTVLIGTAIIGRDPTVWENPSEFRPERMISINDNGGEEVGDVLSFKMLPFGAGRRMCPGYKYGTLILEYFVANLIWQFEWKAVDDVDLTEREAFLVVMKNPVRAKVIPRVK
ncbi:cytochrome P450 89A2-like [Corylus avellana]|uniref:cytochrome P450 89A2-like n=1 Tax=Corylus avellana TaxID=13451 RepID=UPI00286CA647|nr:cytochrome P450 89A2-like [Corylus avellana]